MKRFSSLLLALGLGLLLARFTARAQSVGIGTATPDAKAALDIRATDKGLLVPRLTAAQRTGIAAPPQGLLVYQTDGTPGGGTGTGFWYFGGAPAAWVYLNPAGGGADNLGNHTATQNLNLGANALVGNGASLPAGAVGVGVRADGGLNLGQHEAGNNVLLGYQAGQGLTPNASGNLGQGNQFSGFQSGFSTTTGNLNQFSGFQSGFSNTAGNLNQFSGYRSGYRTTLGTNNVFSGGGSGFDNTTGSYNWAFGYGAGPDVGNLFNAGALGALAKVSQSNSLVLGAAGTLAVQVGIGTGAPAARLHVYGAGSTVLRLQSSNAFGSAGVEFWSDPEGSATEWRPASLRSTDAGGFTGGLAFFTNGTGSANRAGEVEGMRLVNGRLGIGTAAPSFALDVNGAIRCVGAVNTASDARLKRGVRPIGQALAGVGCLRGVRYTFRQSEFPALKLPAGEQLGLLAQEVEQVYPELVSTDGQGYKSVNYAQLTPVLIEAIKELKAANDATTARAAQAEATTAGFAQRLRALEAGGARAQAGPR